MVVGGSGRMAIDDEVIELRQWDAVRVPPGSWRGYEAGPEGLELLIVGAPHLEIVGVDRDDPRVQRWIDWFSGHAVSPEHVADRIITGMRRNRFMVYTSPDIRALYLFKRAMWWPYSVAMRQVNLLFTRALRPGRTPTS